MQTLQDLFHFILQQDRSIVFGNLGRYPQLLFESLVSIPSIRILFVSMRCTLTSKDNRIRVQRFNDPIDPCDLLIFLEPPSLRLIEKHPLASRVVVFTSHFTFKIPNGERWIHICYFHSMNALGIKQLLSIQDFPIQTRNVGLVESNHVNALTLSKRLDAAPPTSNTYAIIDLTHYNKDTLSMYLAFWDAFDYLLEHQTLIHRWVTCFSDHGRPAFIRFTQKVIDALFCRTFEHGNVKDPRTILSLLPFYTSGTMDKTFDVKVSDFGGLQFVAPSTIEDACKAAAMHNVLPLVKNVFWIQD